MSGVGNDEQVRLVAEQLFTVWDSKQQEAAKKDRRWWQGNAPGWISVAVVVCGLILAAGNISNVANDANARSMNNEKAINEMRANNADRLARIETKVDRLLEDQGK